MNDLNARLRATFERVADSDPVPPMPDLSIIRSRADSTLDAPFDDAATSSQPPTRRPRRRALVAGAALAIIGGGVSIAAAAGLPVVPSSVTSALGWTPEPGAINAYPQTARKLFTERGPNGETLQLWYADATANSHCVEFGPAIDGHDATPEGFSQTAGTRREADNIFAGGCGGTVGDRYWNTFGGQSVTSFGPKGPTTFVMRASGAATVSLLFDDGTSRTLPIGDGFTAGWVLRPELALHPVVVGFAADGTEVGRVPIH